MYSEGISCLSEERLCLVKDQGDAKECNSNRKLKGIHSIANLINNSSVGAVGVPREELLLGSTYGR